MQFRILAYFILLLALLFTPFWVFLLLLIISMATFNLFFEAILFSLLSDLFYSAKEIRFSEHLFIFFCASIIALLLIEFLKKKLKFYPK